MKNQTLPPYHVDLNEQSIVLLDQKDVNLLIGLLGEVQLKTGLETYNHIKDSLDRQDEICEILTHKFIKHGVSGVVQPEPADPTQPEYHETD